MDSAIFLITQKTTAKPLISIISNLPLNFLIAETGFDYDKEGATSRSGKLNSELLEKLNKLPFYSTEQPKSLGTEWLQKEFIPLLKNELSIEDKLNTVVEHIAYQISISAKSLRLKKLMLSGGGTRNTYLVERIKHYCTSEIIVPSKEIIDFKEALIFAFLGFRRWHWQTTTLSSVTGAKTDQITG